MSKYITVSTLGSAAVQTHSPGDYRAMIRNMKLHWERELNKILPDRPDLIVLPEVCDAPGNLSPDEKRMYYRERGSVMLEYFRAKARENHCYIAYSSLREMKDSKWRNTTTIIGRTGVAAGTYDKNYPTIEEMRNDAVEPGEEGAVIQCDFGKLACLICFDLNFNELLEAYKRQKPDITIFSSLYHGGLMANYWAYACRTYMAGAVAGLENFIISPVGEKIGASTNYLDYLTQRINLDYCVVHLDYNWPRIDAMKQKYGSKVKITDPGYLGAVLISCETEEFTVKELIEEFHLELLDDYFERSRRFKND